MNIIHKVKTLGLLTIGFLLFSSFISYKSVLSDSTQIPIINELASTNSAYSIRSLLNSSATSVMLISETGGIATITTSTVTPLSTDVVSIILDLGLAFDANNMFSLPLSDEYWLVPFDALSTPTQVSPGGGGGGGGGQTCYSHFCPCSDVPACINKCTPSNNGGSDGRFLSTCTQVVNDNMPCPSGCATKICKTACPTGGIIAPTFDGPCYIIKANSIIFNGVTYN